MGEGEGVKLSVSLSRLGMDCFEYVSEETMS